MLGLLAADGYSESELAPKLPLPELIPLYTKALCFTNEVRLRVDSPNAQYQVGAQVLLFDVNKECFVGIRRNDLSGLNELIAFPRLDSQGEGTAWITNEKQLIFGSPTKSTEGVLLIRKGETLPVVQQASQTFTVLFQRFGREVTITLPRNIGGCLIEPATPPTELILAHEAADAAAQAAAAQAAELAKPAPVFTRPVLPASIARANRESARPASNPAPVSAPASAPIVRSNSMLALSVNELPPGAVLRVTPPPQPQLVASPLAAPVPAAPPQPAAPAVPPPPVLVASAPAPAPTAVPGPVPPSTPAPAPTNPAPVAALARTEPANVASNATLAVTSPTGSNASPAAVAMVPRVISAATTATLARAAPPPAPLPPSTSFRTFLSFNSWTFWVLVLTVAVEGVMIARLLLRKKAGLPAQDAGNQVFSFSSVGESVMDPTTENFVTGTNGDLQGELDKFSMGHVVQFFHSSGESGTLTVSGGNGRVDKIIFDRGQIIDAVSGNRCGETAAEIILRRRQGSFRFTRDDNSKRLRLITQDTMSLLMDAARVIDEKGWSD